jgi:hypothetical protein
MLGDFFSSSFLAETMAAVAAITDWGLFSFFDINPSRDFLSIESSSVSSAVKAIEVLDFDIFFIFASIDFRIPTDGSFFCTTFKV